VSGAVVLLIVHSQSSVKTSVNSCKGIGSRLLGVGGGYYILQTDEN
jgi:hypothetical protein